MSEKPEVPDEKPDGEWVIGWRLQQLLAAGYSADEALTLAARAEVDLHLASDLVRRGCPPDTALRILL